MKKDRQRIDMTYWDYCAHTAPGCLRTLPGGDEDVNFDVIKEAREALFHANKDKRWHVAASSDACVSLDAAHLILESNFPPDIWDSGIIRLEPEESERLKTRKIRLDHPPAWFDGPVRRPYYRMRGVPVSEEQAFEIIRRTDYGIYDLLRDFPQKAKASSGQMFTPYHFRNCWFDKSCYSCHGWAHPSGVIGTNSWTGRLPTFLELLSELLQFQRAFPFLDFVAAFTWWDERPDYAKTTDCWEMHCPYPDFLENICFGVWLHGDTIEFLDLDRAVEKYVEYDKLYSQRDFRVYVPGLRTYADQAYFRRCAASFGVDTGF